MIIEAKIIDSASILEAFNRASSFKGACRDILSEPNAPKLLRALGYYEAYCSDRQDVSVLLYDHLGVTSIRLNYASGVQERKYLAPLSRPKIIHIVLPRLQGNCPSDPTTININDTLYLITSSCNVIKHSKLYSTREVEIDYCYPEVILPSFLSTLRVKLLDKLIVKSPWIMLRQGYKEYRVLICTEKLCNYVVDPLERVIRSSANSIVFNLKGIDLHLVWCKWFLASTVDDEASCSWRDIVVQKPCLLVCIRRVDDHIKALLLNPLKEYTLCKVRIPCSRIVEVKANSISLGEVDVIVNYSSIALSMPPEDLLLLKVKVKTLPRLLRDRCRISSVKECLNLNLFYQKA